MTQGNAVIAVLDDNNTIIWSWHIWFTDCDLLLDHVNLNGKSFLSVNLGWVNGRKLKYNSRSLSDNIILSSGSKSASFKVVQMGDDVQSDGYNTLYQWGRKDPFHAGKWHSSEMKPTDIVISNSKFKIVNNPIPTSPSVANMVRESIKQPGSFFKGSDSWMHYTKSNGDISTAIMSNAWDTEMGYHGKSELTEDKNITSYKSVYDPCPVGYRVPSGADFYALTYPNVEYDSYNHWITISPGFNFPLSGYRKGSNGEFHISKSDGLNHIGQCYSTLLFNQNRAYHFCVNTEKSIHSPHYENSVSSDAMSIRPIKE